jgi:hypothetical protein
MLLLLIGLAGPFGLELGMVLARQGVSFRILGVNPGTGFLSIYISD